MITVDLSNNIAQENSIKWNKTFFIIVKKDVSTKQTSISINKSENKYIYIHI